SVCAAFSIVSMSSLLLVMSVTVVFFPFFLLSFSQSLARCGKALLAAVAAGFLEEIFFRGIIFKGMREDLGRFRGYLFASLFFSAIHFVQPADDALLTGIDPWAGVRHVVDSFHPFFYFETLFPGLLGLFLIGAVLCYAFDRT